MISEVTTPAVAEAIVETPVIDEPIVEVVQEVEAPVVEAVVEATPSEVEEVVASEPVVEAKEAVETVEVANVTQVTEAKPSNANAVKAHASAPMAKAPGTQELKEITINAAPLRTERYQPKGAGSQVAKSQAGSGMMKPTSF